MDLEVQVVIEIKDWLEQEEWENVAVDSQKFSHYTTLDKLLEEYVKVYLKNKLKEIDRNTRLEILMKKKYELIDYFMIFALYSLC